MIFAFEHKHKMGDVCSRGRCRHVMPLDITIGEVTYWDVPMFILWPVSRQDYLNQTQGWNGIPPLPTGRKVYFYEVLLGTPSLLFTASSANMALVTPKKPEPGVMVVEVAWHKAATPEDEAECKAWIIRQGRISPTSHSIELAEGQDAIATARLAMHEGTEQ